MDTYFRREVLPHASDAWIDAEKTEVGYEIPFNRHVSSRRARLNHQFEHGLIEEAEVPAYEKRAQRLVREINYPVTIFVPIFQGHFRLILLVLMDIDTQVVQFFKTDCLSIAQILISFIANDRQSWKVVVDPANTTGPIQGSILSWRE